MSTLIRPRSLHRPVALALTAVGLLLGFATSGPGAVRAQVDPPEPPSCEARCEAEAVAVRDACLAQGGTPELCEVRYRDTLARCLETCPEEPTPATCEARCAQVAREVYELCIASGRGPDVCEAEAARAREACLLECLPTRTPTPDPGSLSTPTPTPHPGNLTTPTWTPTPNAGNVRTVTPTPGSVIPTAVTCRGRCELLGRQAYDRCIAGGGGADACERQAAEVRENCIRRECEPTSTPTPGNNAGTPVTCEGKCAQVAREAYERCIAGGGGADACEREANAARERCLNECPRDRTATPRPAEATPVGCEARCADRARQVYEGCIASGRGADACEAEAASARAACLRECPGGAVATPSTNAACADRCESIARDIRARCLAAGGGEDRCHAEAESARRACLASCQPASVIPPAATCAQKCELHGQAVFQRCLSEGGTEAGCRERSNAAERACAAGCADQPGSDCAGRCKARGRDIELLCLAKGENPAVCARAGAAAEAACRLECSPGSVDPFCESACRSLANVAYRRCVRAGGSYADCRALRERELTACVERCLRNEPLRPTAERP